MGWVAILAFVQHGLTITYNYLTILSHGTLFNRSSQRKQGEHADSIQTGHSITQSAKSFQ